MILAGGEGKRLRPLTSVRTKPAVPFGGNYRIIDKHVVIQPGTVIGHDPEEDANRFETTEDGIVVIPKGAEIG